MQYHDINKDMPRYGRLFREVVKASRRAYDHRIGTEDRSIEEYVMDRLAQFYVDSLKLGLVELYKKALVEEQELYGPAREREEREREARLYGQEEVS